MIEISQIRLPVDHDDTALEKGLLRKLRAGSERLRDWKIHRRAIDARKHVDGGIRLIYTIHADVGDQEEQIIAAAKSPDVRVASQSVFLSPRDSSGSSNRPVIIGAGPCGYFAALVLARAGLKPIILERGKAAGPRARDVTRFWRGESDVNPESNVQFGEGGAGTFSDGKLYTGIRDRDGAVRYVLEELAAHGAPGDILIKGKPHIGTDRLITVLRSLRREILEHGGEIRFETRVEDILLENGTLRGLKTATGEELEVNKVILAVGHSARETFEMLHGHGIPMEAKPFSVGARIEHPQAMIDRSLYGEQSGHPLLGAAPYKFARRGRGRKARGCYSFCMCPGGLVVASSSSPGLIVTNGMSSYARDDANANSGFMVEVFPDDFGDTTHPLAGIAFQKDLEQRAFNLGGADGKAPAQLLGDFMKGTPSRELGKVKPSYRPGIMLTDLRECLPDYVVKTMQEAVAGITKQIKGFNRHDAILTATETRSSSPLRILRDDSMQSPAAKGLYPAGEGAGYAGGILSAAADGLRVASTLAGQ